MLHGMLKTKTKKDRENRYYVRMLRRIYEFIAFRFLEANTVQIDYFLIYLLSCAFYYYSTLWCYVNKSFALALVHIDQTVIFLSHIFQQTPFIASCVEDKNTHNA